MANLLQNSGFETGTGLPDFWNKFGTSPTSVWTWEPAGTGMNGSRSVSISETNPVLPFTQWPYWSQGLISVVAGNIYELNGYISTLNVLGNDGATIGVDWYVGMAWAATGPRIGLVKGNTPFGTKYTISTTVPTSTLAGIPNGALVVIQLTGTGKALFDDISFCPGVCTGCVNPNPNLSVQ